MMGILKRPLLAALFFLGSIASVNALAFTGAEAQRVLPLLNLDSMGSDILGDHPVLAGEWHGRHDWSGRFCNKFWQYQISVKATLSNLNLDLNDDNSLSVTADLTGIDVDANGAYKSNATVCREVSLDVPLSSDGAQVVGLVTFEGGDQIANAHVQVQSTTIQQLHFGFWVPTQVEDLITKLTNQALQEVWRSKLGNWISDYLTKRIKDQLPQIPGAR